MQRLCAVSVDLDAARLYRRLHGVRQRDERDPCYGVALERILDLQRQLRMRLSLFVVGQDGAAASPQLQRCCRAGAVLENHSYSHPYGLSGAPTAQLDAEIDATQRLLRDISGRAPEVFRAPGYTQSEALLDALERARIPFDSSLLPSPAYRLAKLAIMGAMRLRGRRSAASWRGAAMALAPRHPFRPGRYFRPGGRPIVELPISVTPRLRLPFIGTTVCSPLGAAFTRAMLADRFVNLELHALDFLDGGDGLADLVGYQPDLRQPWQRKRGRLARCLETLRDAGFRLVDTATAAHSLGSCSGDDA